MRRASGSRRHRPGVELPVRIQQGVGTIRWRSLVCPGGAGYRKCSRTIQSVGGVFVGRKGMALNHVCGNQPTQVDGAAWAEKYQGCCAEAEWVEFQQLATDIMRVQLKNQKYSNSHGAINSLQRAFHAKPTLSVDDATLEFHRSLLPELQVGDFASPGRSHPTKVRFTNANGRRLDDRKKDIRGVALRVAVVPDQGGGPAQDHDLLMTNFPVSHARDAR